MTNSRKSVKPVEKKIVFNRLINDRDFELVYKTGLVIISEDKKIKANYLFESKDINNTVKIGLSVASKKGNSVWRNRLKRILRESLRMDRENLQNIIELKNVNLLIIFSPYSINQTNSKKIFLKEIKPAIWDILKRIGK
ncbi:MAG: ribonuclease P protein component [Ignavibacteriaceae bacterium]|nr:ribonuclease P protein component [Ignavibacteriaceae bacterium]